MFTPQDFWSMFGHFTLCLKGLMKPWCKLKRPTNIQTWVFYQSQVFKQNVTIKKSCHSKPNTTQQFEKNINKQNHVSASTSSQELQICGYLFDHTKTLNLQFFFLTARLVGLLLREPWPESKWCFIKIFTWSSIFDIYSLDYLYFSVFIFHVGRTLSK